MSLQLPLLIIFIGAVLLIFLVMNVIFKRLKLPPLIGYILLGWVVRLFDVFVTEQMLFSFNLLAKIGVILLLFHIGIESNLKKLLSVIGKAGFVTLWVIIISGVLPFLAAYAFGLGLAPSLIIGVAMTATSISVSTASWGEKALRERPEGSFLLDLATLDDIIGILLLALLFAFVGGEFTAEWKILLFFFLKLSLFIGGCYLFSHFAEKKLMTELIHYEKMPDSMLSVVGIGLLIAGIASLIQFSLVIGGFFAGLAFSRDPRSVRIDASMKSLIDFFVPFFFFWIGYQIVLSSLVGMWLFFVVLLLMAIVGKLIGVWIPAFFLKIPLLGSLLLGVSMIPRAEVCMVVMDRGLELGWVTQTEYSAVALIVLITCLGVALSIKPLLRKC